MKIMLDQQVWSESATEHDLDEVLDGFWRAEVPVTLEALDGRLVYVTHSGPQQATVQYWDATGAEEVYTSISPQQLQQSLTTLVRDDAYGWRDALRSTPTPGLFVPPAPRKLSLPTWAIVLIILLFLAAIFI